MRFCVLRFPKRGDVRPYSFPESKPAHIIENSIPITSKLNAFQPVT
ncbi:hypothetical protein PHO31112_05174 [Pandoraea horticolens]|uniref:Uncharacterized protein n=1 Tax=Pandoraea horticolens TaxID=2508298 RepID=A0A5E4ZA31_9BURK|nr:hypothetical protein PHO31112_05174 [Pandoraea horticolens]